MKEILAQFARQAGVTIDILEQTDSTNNRAAESRYGAGDVVIAERQEAGRGQRGNSWSSTPGENLTFSVVLRPDFLPAERQFRISKAVALAVADTIAEAGLRPAIKWPNDIYIGDRKVTGILIENDLMGPYLSRSVIGIGLNVNQTRFDPALPNPTSLAAEAGHPFDRRYSSVFTATWPSATGRWSGKKRGKRGRLEKPARSGHRWPTKRTGRTKQAAWPTATRSPRQDTTAHRHSTRTTCGCSTDSDRSTCTPTDAHGSNSSARSRACSPEANWKCATAPTAS